MKSEKRMAGKGGPIKKETTIYNADKDIVVINGLEIDIEKITDEQLYSLRKVLPRKEYR